MFGTYKRKVILLGAGLALAIVAGYQLAIRKTLALYDENKELKALTSRDATEMMQEIAAGVRVQKRLDSLMNAVNTGASRAEMITLLFQMAERHNLTVTSVREEDQRDQEYFLYYFRFSGMFVNMVKFIRSVEQGLSAGKIESVEIVKESDRRTKEEHLLLELIIRKLDYGS